jgi:flavin reductase (DIM6/NTAB) family NADH-FMN oxidoreductase RutF
MKIDPASMGGRDRQKLLGSLVVPRPISLVSTITQKGNSNLAPYSLFNLVCYTPPMVFITPMRKGQGAKKDTLVNIEHNGQFVINLVTEGIAEQMNLTSSPYPPEVDEFAESKLTPVPSDLVKPPRVAESPVSLECRLDRIVQLGEPEVTGDMILGNILRVHIQDRLYKDGALDAAAVHLIGRMGFGLYTRTSDLFDMKQP